MRPHGISTILDKVPSIDEDPRYATLTGFTATSGSEPENACEDAPTGYVKGCVLTARFGLVRRDTQTIEMDKVMLRLNRSDFKDSGPGWKRTWSNRPGAIWSKPRHRC